MKQPTMGAAVAAKQSIGAAQQQLTPFNLTNWATNQSAPVWPSNWMDHANQLLANQMREIPNPLYLLRLKPFDQSMSHTVPLLKFHVMVWREVTQETELCLMQQTTDLGGHDSWFLGFSSKEKFEKAELWFDKYFALFTQQNILEDVYPRFNEGTYAKLIFVKSDFTDADVGFKKWVWIISRCTGRVWASGREFFIFENEEDAVAYKLNWS